MEENKNKNKDRTSIRVHTWLSTAVFFLTQEGERGGGQRAEEEGGRRRLQSLDTHDLLIQSSHNSGRSEVKKTFHTVFMYKPQLGWNKQTSNIYSSWKTCSHTRCWILQVKTGNEIWQSVDYKKFKSCCWRREKERPSEYLWLKRLQRVCAVIICHITACL